MTTADRIPALVERLTTLVEDTGDLPIVAAEEASRGLVTWPTAASLDEACSYLRRALLSLLMASRELPPVPGSQTAEADRLLAIYRASQ